MMIALLVALAAAPAGEGLPAVMVARGIPSEAVVVAFDGSPAIARFAEAAVGERREPKDRAHALYDAILELEESGAIEGDRDNTPKARHPKTAAELLAAAEAAGEDVDRRAGCYEFSVLYVAAARSLGLDAVGVERLNPAGTGQIGHVMAGVRLGDSERLTVFDLQNETRGTRSRIRELDDLAFAGHHYNHLAVAHFLRGHPDRAKLAIDWALALAPRSASFLNNRATVLAALGEPVLAVAEATYAVQLGPDVPLYRYQLGRLRMLTRDLDGAKRALRNALRLRPRYGLAKRDLAWATLLSGDAESARRQLEALWREHRDTPEVELYLGLLYLAAGKSERALEVIDDGLSRRADDSSLLALASLAGRRRAGVDAAQVARLEQVLGTVTRASGRP